MAYSEGSEAKTGEDAFDPIPHLRRLRPGAILLARDLDDPNFARSLVLLCQHAPEGSYGLILNRPVRMPLDEIFDVEALPVASTHELHRVYVGGPVQPEELQVLQVAQKASENAVEVDQGVFVGGHFDQLSPLLAAEQKEIRLFLGYSGWSPGQLEQEVQWGAWEVWEVSVRKLLQASEPAWLSQDPEVLRKLLRDFPSEGSP